MVDTADMYGPFSGEEQLGQALKRRRDGLTVATKGEGHSRPDREVRRRPERAPGLLADVRGILTAQVGDDPHRPVLPAPRCRRTCRVQMGSCLDRVARGHDGRDTICASPCLILSTSIWYGSYCC
ncbi:aldo/keto reductase [Amycolatopsis sp. NPDC049868]|uniref:aldo/keto reductase n=1 Tax=Amycolatopsis sp. NPDC049868 TaxID=3363934 RepID=UPI0037997BF5